MAMRTRVRSSLTTTPVVRQWETNWNGCASVADRAISSLGTVGQGSYESMSDVVIPNFHKRRANGELFFNPMERYVYEGRDAGGTGALLRTTPNSCSSPLRYHDFYHDGNILPARLKSKYSMNGTEIPPVVDLLSSSEISDLLAEASTKCMSERSKPPSNLFESAAEYGQTVELLKKPVRELELLSRKWPVTSSLNAATSAWLKYRYGIKPLVGDITLILENRALKSSRVRQTTRSTSKSSKDDSRTDVVVGGALSSNLHIVTKDEIVVRAFSLDEFIQDRAFESGISLSGLITLPWELLPYSFVADWFVNAGDYIGALVPTPSFQHLGHMVVAKRKTVSTYTLGTSWSTASNTTVIVPPSGAYVSTRYHVSRTPSPQPRLVIKSDFRFHKPTRVLDALSLVYQRANRSFALGRFKR